MMQRRNFLSGLGRAGVAGAMASTFGAWAQRPAHPIARPPRPGGPVLPGRFAPEGGVAGGTAPGMYVVVSVDSMGGMLRLSDGSRTADVKVDENMIDLDTLKPGDQVQVDFMVPNPGDTVLKAGNVWKL